MTRDYVYKLQYRSARSAVECRVLVLANTYLITTGTNITQQSQLKYCQLTRGETICTMVHVRISYFLWHAQLVTKGLNKETTFECYASVALSIPAGCLENLLGGAKVFGAQCWKNLGVPRPLLGHMSQWWVMCEGCQEWWKVWSEFLSWKKRVCWSLGCWSSFHSLAIQCSSRQSNSGLFYWPWAVTNKNDMWFSSNPPKIVLVFASADEDNSNANRG